jgi:V8-like Glu-specific endopeptidase
VEWEKGAVAPGTGLTVFGYPKIALHLPSLYQSTAELHSISKKYLSTHNSLIISSTTHPGCSGGPVLDLRGFAVGVVEQENSLEQKTGLSTYFSATPAYYLRELFAAKSGAGASGSQDNLG